MSVALGQAVVSLTQSPFPPLAVGFFGLGTGYLIWGPQELFHYPERDERVDFATGMWGIWMPGFMQFFAGVYLFAGLALFGTFKTPALYMAALAFTAYGVHWFAIGWNRLHQADPRVNVGMAFAFTLISILGIIVFFSAGDHPRRRRVHRPHLRLRRGLLRLAGLRAARDQRAGRARARLLPHRHGPVAHVPDLRRGAQLRARVHAAGLTAAGRARGGMSDQDVR